jgi:hypothetical protein
MFCGFLCNFAAAQGLNRVRLVWKNIIGASFRWILIDDAMQTSGGALSLKGKQTGGTLTRGK